MPDRFKVTKTDAPEIEATFNSILKDDEAAVRGKLLPTPVLTEKKGESYSFLLLLFLLSCSFDIFIAPFAPDLI